MQMLKAWRIRKMCICKGQRWKEPWWESHTVWWTGRGTHTYIIGAENTTMEETGGLMGPSNTLWGNTGCFVSQGAFLTPNMDVSDAFYFKHSVFSKCIMSALYVLNYYQLSVKMVCCSAIVYFWVMHPPKASYYCYYYYYCSVLYLLWKCCCRQ